MRRLGLGIAVAIGLTLPAFGQEAIKPPDGFYVLNLAKSSIRGPAPKAEALKLEGNTMTIENFGNDGKARIFVAETIVDGKPHPITDSPLFDTQTATQLDPYTVGVTRTKDGKVTQTGVAIFNPTTNTITATLIGANGRYSHLMVYEKQ
jgi:hypothetical protein